MIVPTSGGMQHLIAIHPFAYLLKHTETSATVVKITYFLGSNSRRYSVS